MLATAFCYYAEIEILRHSSRKKTVKVYRTRTLNADLNNLEATEKVKFISWCYFIEITLARNPKKPLN